MLGRRTFFARMAGLLVTGVSGRQLAAQVPIFHRRPLPITVYKSRTCGCCAKWVDHLRGDGFDATVHDREDMEQLKDKLGVPKEVRSCHTAQIGRYLIEGHVPAADIRRLMAEQPGVAGLAVPDMPSGTPGMAPPGAKIEGFDVVAFQPDGAIRTFARY